MATNNHLIVFARNPRLGKIKTRLAKSIGNKNALKVYLHLLEHTAHVVGELKCVKHIYYDSFIEKDDFFLNTEKSDYKTLIARLKDISETISLLEKKYLEKF